MWQPPIPFGDPYYEKTFLITDGYPIDCTCITGQTINVDLSGATLMVDLSSIESRLDTIISDGSDRNTLLQDILAELVEMNPELTQTITTTSIAGSIPSGVQSYIIVNLGLNPNNPATTYNPMVIKWNFF